MDDEIHRTIRKTIGQMSMIKSQNDGVSPQLCIYNKKKDLFVAAMEEEEECRQKIMQLLLKCDIGFLGPTISFC